MTGPDNSQTLSYFPTVEGQQYVSPLSSLSRLETLGVLFGLRPSPSSEWNVLEIGCGEGTNLLALAEMYPNANFTGYDSSERSISILQERVQEFGLKNVILSVDMGAIQALGRCFDCVIVWNQLGAMKPPEQYALVKALSQILSPHGLVLINFPCLPGGELRKLFRQLFSPPENVPPPAYHRFVNGIVQELRQDNDFGEGGIFSNMSEHYDALVKSELSNSHQGIHPLSFGDFQDILKDNELSYLGDAVVSSNFGLSLPVKIRAPLQKTLSVDMKSFETLFDLLSNRQSRNALIVQGNNFPHRRNQLEAFLHLFASLPTGNIECEGLKVSISLSSGAKLEVTGLGASLLVQRLKESDTRYCRLADIIGGKRRISTNEEREIISSAAQLFWHGFLPLFVTPPENEFESLQTYPVYQFMKAKFGNGYDAFWG